jgi:hypothetical protein
MPDETLTSTIRAGLVPSDAPLLDQLRALRFCLAPHTRAAVLKLTGEEP